MVALSINEGRQIFNAFIRVTDFQELHMGGRRFTWIGPGELKLTKLDRFLLSRGLLDIWKDTAVLALDRRFANHCPILLKSASADFGPIPFRFFNQWLHLEGFNEMVTLIWNSTTLAGSASFVLKEKFKGVKKRIKL